MKSYFDSGGTAPRILNLDTRWRWVVSFTPTPLYLRGKSHQYPLSRRLGGPHILSGRGGKEKNSQPRQEFHASRLARSLVSILTELPRLRRDVMWSIVTFTFHLCGRKNCIKNLVIKPVGRPRYRWNDIKMKLRDVDYTELA
jgi:hypothetical protein